MKCLSEYLTSEFVRLALQDWLPEELSSEAARGIGQ